MSTTATPQQKRKHLAAGIASLALGFMSIGIAFAPFGGSAANENTNDPSYWCDDGIKYEDPGSPYVVPEAEGFVWTSAIVKAGHTGTSVIDEHHVYEPVAAGDVLVHPEKDSISWVILCRGPIPTTTTTAPTTSTEAPTTTSPAETTTTTTTIEDTTTTTIEEREPTETSVEPTTPEVTTTTAVAPPTTEGEASPPVPATTTTTAATTVTTAVDQAGPVPSPVEALPETGVQDTVLAIAGGLLVLLGAALVWIGRPVRA
jgi:LPXTG-motif cell wall-anchored protein